jgi:hypothetical protein
MVNGIGLTNASKSLPKGVICAMIVSDAVSLNASPRRCRSGRVDSARTGSRECKILSRCIDLRCNSSVGFAVECSTLHDSGNIGFQAPGKLDEMIVAFGHYPARAILHSWPAVIRLDVRKHTPPPAPRGCQHPTEVPNLYGRNENPHPGSMIPSSFTGASWKLRSFRLKMCSYFTSVSTSCTTKWNSPSCPSWPGSAC